MPSKRKQRRALQRARAQEKSSQTDVEVDEIIKEHTVDGVQKVHEENHAEAATTTPGKASINDEEKYLRALKDIEIYKKREVSIADILFTKVKIFVSIPVI